LHFALGLSRQVSTPSSCRLGNCLFAHDNSGTVVEYWTKHCWFYHHQDDEVPKELVDLAILLFRMTRNDDL
jgi:hypothetical protein